MAGRVIGGEGSRRAFWQGHLDAWRGSGVSVRAYCRKHGLGEPSFYSWRRRLGPGGRPVSARAGDDRGHADLAPKAGKHGRRLSGVFAEVRVVQDGPRLDAARVAVRLGDRREVRVWPGFDAATLVRVVAALEGSGC